MKKTKEEEQQAGRRLAFNLINLHGIEIDPLGREQRSPEFFREVARLADEDLNDQLLAGLTPQAWKEADRVLQEIHESGSLPNDFRPIIKARIT